jgi:N-methylhydantoinase A
MNAAAAIPSPPFRVTVDVGGTFSDVTVTDQAGHLWISKSPTTRDRASIAILDALESLSPELGGDAKTTLSNTSLFVYSTTRATNAILERRTARTAFLTTQGFPDILVRREGGRANAFENREPFPEPFISRDMTFEVPERINAEGGIERALQPADVLALVGQLAARKVEAVAVCLLWSVRNPVHELLIGELFAEHLDGVAVTLSHQIWPSLREYRRASATAIDASLKPLMAEHLSIIEADLYDNNFRGELLAATSFGGVMHLAELSRQPIYSVKSGPALAPTAGRAYASALSASQHTAPAQNIVVCDTGGTSFDVSLVRDGQIVLTSETWLGARFTGDLLPTSSVDARSIGSGGGSIASLDRGGLLRVGPESAGAQPGPACYGRGGTKPTVTDAAAVLGYLDPDFFMGGRLQLDLDAARTAIHQLAGELGMSDEAAAIAILNVANEHMVDAIRDITVNEGIDPRECLLVAGGGAAGLTIGAIVAEIGAPEVLIPSAAGTLSAVGGQHSDIVAEFNTALGVSNTDHLDLNAVTAAYDHLRGRAEEFGAEMERRGLPAVTLEYFAEARYAFQVWTMELPVDLPALITTADTSAVSANFDRLHERVYAVSEP